MQDGIGGLAVYANVLHLLSQAGLQLLGFEVCILEGRQPLLLGQAHGVLLAFHGLQGCLQMGGNFLSALR